MSEISFSMKTTHPQTKMTVCERDRFILCESDHLRRTVPSRGLSGDTTTCAILTPSTITVTSVGPDERKVYFTSSSVHDASTQTPPLALNPRKRPSCQSLRAIPHSSRAPLRFGQLPDDYPCLLDQTFVIAIEVVHILRGKDEVVEQVRTMAVAFSLACATDVGFPLTRKQFSGEVAGEGARPCSVSDRKSMQNRALSLRIGQMRARYDLSRSNRFRHIHACPKGQNDHIGSPFAGKALRQISTLWNTDDPL